MRLINLFRRRRMEADLDDEMRSSLELLSEQYRARGLNDADARRAAQLEFGGVEQVKEEVRQVRRGALAEQVWQDLRYAARTLRRSPGFVFAAILSLALGIGANTAVFSVVHAVLLRALPYAESDRLIHIDDLTMADFEALQNRNDLFSGVGGYRSASQGNLGPASVRVMPVTSDFFRTLGFRQSFSGPDAIVLSAGLREIAFGTPSDITGRSVAIGDKAYTVSGELPRNFWFPQPVDAFVLLRSGGSLSDYGTNTPVIARLKPGVTLNQARAALRKMKLTPWQEWLTGDIRLTLLLLFGAVALLLLIACSNLASLLMARLAARQREIGVRLALGCSRARLHRQFLIENLMLSFTGGFLGIFGAWWLLKGLLAVMPLGIPSSLPIGISVPVLAFTASLVVIVSFLFSLAPYLMRLGGRSSALTDALKSSRNSASGGGARHRIRSVLVVGQVALSVTLLVGAVLMIRSLYRMHQEHLGFSPEGVLTFRTPRKTGRAEFRNALLSRFQNLPGAHGAAMVNALPLTGQNNMPAERAGHPEQAIGGTEIRIVTPDFFAVMKTPVLRGRAFGPGDATSALPVILVNETLARRWWPSGNELGDRIEIGRFHGVDYANGAERPRVIVGVVADTKTVELKAPPRPTVFIPAAQAFWYDSDMSWVVSNVSPAAVRGIVAEIDPTQRIDRMRTMQEIVASTTVDSRFDAWLFGMFAAVALLLSTIGIYGLLSFSVSRRTGEFGTRMALGASPSDVLTLVLVQGVTLTLIGLAIGLAGAFALTRSLASLLFGVGMHDPVSFAFTAATLLAAGAVASYVPARRATRVDPMTALRCE